jgi:hypothetical protein
MYRQIKGVEPMFDYKIPHPKYTLTRYTTKQLRIWYEDCVLLEFMMRKGEISMNHLAYSEVQIRRWEIDDILQERGISHLELGRVVRLTKEDVRS